MIEKFIDNYLLGCIKFNNTYNFYLMPIAWWILNYKKYDPAYNPNDWEFMFRNNILNVVDDEIEHFFQTIEPDKLNLEEFKQTIKSLDLKYKNVYFFIDFDKKEFVNGFFDIEVEEYLPDKSWKGMDGVPFNYLPTEWKLLFK